MCILTNFPLVRREPVDWKDLNILDYPEKVRNPMDLWTVMKKLDNSEYNTVEEGVSGTSVFHMACPPLLVPYLFKFKSVRIENDEMMAL